MAYLDIAIDLGTCNMVAGNRKKGILLREPTIVAVESKSKKILGIGQEAEGMLGREHSAMQVLRPMANGVISNYAMTQVLAKYIMKKVGSSLFFKPRIIACIPGQVTGLEAQSMMDTMMEAGARNIVLIQESVAAAVGAGMDLTKAEGNLIVDVGGGTTDVAVLSMGGVVAKSSTLFAGNAMDEAIEKYLRSSHNMVVGPTTAEMIKKELASVWTGSPQKTMEVKGRGSITGLPTKVVLDRRDLYLVLDDIVRGIIRTIGQTLERTPPELSGDISKNGIWLTGGGAYLEGLSERLSEAAHVAVHIPEHPMDASILGALKSFDYWGTDFDGFYNPKNVR